MFSSSLPAALEGVLRGERGLHPGACSSGSEGEPGDDTGLQTVHRSE